MKKTYLTTVTLTSAVAMALFLAASSFAQGPPAGPQGGPGGGGGGRAGRGGRGGAPAQPAGPMPKGPDGHPDFSGFWNLPDPPQSGVERVDAPAGAH